MIDLAVSVREFFRRGAMCIVPFGMLSLVACEQERCDPPIDREAAIASAKEYFLSRSIAKLEAGPAYERAEAKRMREAGMTEEIYRDTFQRSIEGRPRKIENKFCEHPFIYYQARRSLNYDGFDVYFNRVTSDDPSRWEITTTGVNINSCGSFTRYFETDRFVMFDRKDGITNQDDIAGMGFGSCP